MPFRLVLMCGGEVLEMGMPESVKNAAKAVEFCNRVTDALCAAGTRQFLVRGLQESGAGAVEVFSFRQRVQKVARPMPVVA